MDDETGMTAEERLAQLFLLSLVAREATWAEIADELTARDDLESRWRPAPVTLKSRPFANG